MSSWSTSSAALPKRSTTSTCADERVALGARLRQLDQLELGRRRAGRRRRPAPRRAPGGPPPGRRCRGRGRSPTPARAGAASATRPRPARRRRSAPRRGSAARCRGRPGCGRPPLRSATARRSVPTWGSTTATCTPTGMNGQRVAQHERALADGVALDAVGDVDDPRLGWIAVDHPVADADEVVVAPVVGEQRDDHAAPGAPPHRHQRVDQARRCRGARPPRPARCRARAAPRS